MDLSEVLNSLRVVQLPMRTKFRGITTREVAIFQGESGWGEFSPFLEYGAEESAKWLRSGIEAASGPKFPVLRNSIKINGTIPATDDREEIAALIALYPGAEVFKVKVGTGIDADLSRLRVVRDLVPKAKLRIDVNGSWSVAEAEGNLKAILDEIGPLEYVEQPVASLDSLRELKRRLKGELPIVGDEVIRKTEDPLRVNLEGAVDILMLKVAPLGGVKKSLDIARHHRLPVVVSSALESAIGISHGMRLAAALPNLEYASGLATGSLLKSDLAANEIKNGEIRLDDVEPNLDSLERFAVPKERLEWWRERVKSCWEVAA